MTMEDQEKCVRVVEITEYTIFRVNPDGTFRKGGAIKKSRDKRKVEHFIKVNGYKLISTNSD